MKFYTTEDETVQLGAPLSKGHVLEPLRHILLGPGLGKVAVSLPGDLCPELPNQALRDRTQEVLLVKDGSTDVRDMTFGELEESLRTDPTFDLWDVERYRGAWWDSWR